MSGWLILVLLAAATAGGLIAVARPTRPALMLVAAAVMIAFAGYAWQGRPSLPGKPTGPRDARAAPDTMFADERKQLLETVGPDPQILDAADQLIASDDADYAVGTLRAALARRPQSMLLWLGLGNALVHHADGAVTPPARYAFDRAGAIGRGHPAPAYFLGMAYATSGDLAAADTVWSEALKTPPADRQWHERLLVRLFLLRRIEASAPPSH